jgi:uncharacterized protein (TIGR02118 family)
MKNSINVFAAAVSAALVLAALGLVPVRADYPAPDASERQPGFKFMVLLNRKEDMSFEEFERYFFDQHLPYVLAIPGVRGYVVNLRGADDTEAPYDGISEFWFDDRDAFERAMASPETDVTLADAANFLLPVQILLVEERIVVPPRR